jgi:hypothetical protein
MRRLPGPAQTGRGDEGDFRGSLTLCFGTGREHKLNLLRRPSGPEAANGCPVLLTAGTNRRETQNAQTHPD